MFHSRAGAEVRHGPGAAVGLATGSPGERSPIMGRPWGKRHRSGRNPRKSARLRHQAGAYHRHHPGPGGANPTPGLARANLNKS